MLVVPNDDSFRPLLPYRFLTPILDLILFQVCAGVHHVPEVHLGLRRLGLRGHPVGDVQLRFPALGCADRFVEAFASSTLGPPVSS